MPRAQYPRSRINSSGSCVMEGLKASRRRRQGYDTPRKYVQKRPAQKTGLMSGAYMLCLQQGQEMMNEYLWSSQSSPKSLFRPSSQSTFESLLFLEHSLSFRPRIPTIISVRFSAINSSSAYILPNRSVETCSRGSCSSPEHPFYRLR